MCISIILTYISLAPGPVKMTMVSTGLRAWLNGNAGNVIRTFTEKKNNNNKKGSVYFCYEQIECFTFNIFQHHQTSDNNDSYKDV